jgi:hypothetical protein
MHQKLSGLSGLGGHGLIRGGLKVSAKIQKLDHDQIAKSQSQRDNSRYNRHPFWSSHGASKPNTSCSQTSSLSVVKAQYLHSRTVESGRS